MRKARVIVTHSCNRSCDGCCNKDIDMNKVKKVDNLNDLIDYDEVMITGGEPLLLDQRVKSMASVLRYYSNQRGRIVNIYLYTAYCPDWPSPIIKMFDGIHYTIHYPCNDEDVRMLKKMTEALEDVKKERFSTRLAIDKRCFEDYDFSNIDFSSWDVIRRMEWKKDCPLPEGEELLIYDLENVHRGE